MHPVGPHSCTPQGPTLAPRETPPLSPSPMGPRHLASRGTPPSCCRHRDDVAPLRFGPHRTPHRTPPSQLAIPHPYTLLDHLLPSGGTPSSQLVGSHPCTPPMGPRPHTPWTPPSYPSHSTFAPRKTPPSHHAGPNPRTLHDPTIPPHRTPPSHSTGPHGTPRDPTCDVDVAAAGTSHPVGRHPSNIHPTPWDPSLTTCGAPASHPMGPLPDTPWVPSSSYSMGSLTPHRTPPSHPTGPHPHTPWDPTPHTPDIAPWDPILTPRGTPPVHPQGLTLRHPQDPCIPREPTLMRSTS